MFTNRFPSNTSYMSSFFFKMSFKNILFLCTKCVKFKKNINIAAGQQFILSSLINQSDHNRCLALANMYSGCSSKCIFTVGFILLKKCLSQAESKITMNFFVLDFRPMPTQDIQKTKKSFKMHTCTLQQSRISPTEQIYYTLGNPFAVNVISDKNI